MNDFDLFMKLAHVKRYSMTHLARPESVLEHTGMAAGLAYLFCTRIPEFKIIQGEILGKAIVHDWDEVVTGDIPMPTKYFSTTLREEIGKMERTKLDELLREIDGVNSYDMLSDWMKSKQGLSGWVVGLCDLLCVLGKIQEEVFMFNNFAFAEYAIGMEDKLKQKYNAVDHLDLSNSSRSTLKEYIKQAILLNNLILERIKK